MVISDDITVFCVIHFGVDLNILPNKYDLGILAGLEKGVAGCFVEILLTLRNNKRGGCGMVISNNITVFCVIH